MAYNRAFSDTEIVTIAAVAAAALGGIVVGLGRGQANEASAPGAAERIRELSSAGVSRAQEALPERRELASQVHRLQEQARRLPDPREADVSPVREALAGIAENIKQSDLSHEVGSWLQQLSDKDGHLSSMRESRKSAARAGSRRLPSRGQVGGTLAQIAATVGGIIESQREKRGDTGRGFSIPSPSDRAGMLRERVSDVVERVGEHVPSTDSTDQARARASEALHTHVAEPVSRAASTTKDSTQEALAAALWLTAGAGIVYFGLLSADRREQVKDFICGAFEQARLLALDFQGYESEL
jgi:hypothetical protein